MFKISVGILLLLILQINCSGQIDFDNPPWNTGCDTSGFTQYEMNMCSKEKFDIADSVLNSQYDEVISYMESNMKRHFTKYILSFSSSQLEEYVYFFIQKNQVIKSKSDFLTFRKSITEIIAKEYEGGTMMGMAMCNYSLDLTVNQIKILEKLQDEIIH